MRYGSDHYLETAGGLLAQYRKRELARLRFWIKGVEPRAKHSMPPNDKVEIQRQLEQSMTDLRRKAFRSPVALRLTAQTTEATPTHSHHIAKNLLDLFSKPLPQLNSGRKSLLYVDDQQVHALSILCHHGETKSLIRGEARPLRDLIQDLALSVKVQEEQELRDMRRDEFNLDMNLDHYMDLRRDAAMYVNFLGHESYEAWLRLAHQQAQEAMLSKSRLQPRDLYYLFDQGPSWRPFSDTADMWEQVFSMSPLRIRLSELPQVKGSSAIWKAEIDEKLRQFRAKHAWLFDPVLTPVALEVVIRPPAPSSAHALHDLDNVLRSYLLPKVLEILKPMSHHSFTIDFDALTRNLDNKPLPPAFAEWVASRKTPPASTRTGVTRYEAWRLPPAQEGSKGFVSLALIADQSGTSDVMSRLDSDLADWKDSLSRSSSSRAIHRYR